MPYYQRGSFSQFAQIPLSENSSHIKILDAKQRKHMYQWLIWYRVEVMLGTKVDPQERRFRC